MRRYRSGVPYVGKFPRTSLAREAWPELGACTPKVAGPGWDPTLHYDRDRVGEALQVCASCPVTAQCLAYARANGIGEGVWGGVPLWPGAGQPGEESAA